MNRIELLGFRESFNKMDKKNKFNYLLEQYLSRFTKMFQIDENLLSEKFLPQEKVSETFTGLFQEFLNNEKNVLVIPLSGFSGVGKGFITKELLNLSKNLGIYVETIELDEFLNSTRGTKERFDMSNSDIGFEEYFYNQSNINKLLETAIYGEIGKSIHLTGLYNSKDNGKLTGEKDYIVPNVSKRIIFVDGVGAGNFVNKVDTECVRDNKNRVEIQGITILDDPAESILRALIRDLQNKPGINLKEVTFSRIKEYTVKMWEWIYKNVRDTKYIAFNDPIKILEQNINLLLESNADLTKEIIYKNILEGIEEFKRQKLENNEKWSNKNHLAKIFSEKLIENMKQRLKEVLNKN